MKIERHTFQGKFLGHWYEIDGKVVYIANRRPSQMHRGKKGWMIDIMTLRRAQEDGCKMIGVVTKVGKKKRLYLTWLEDFFQSPYAFEHWGDTRQIGLPLGRFRVNPGNNEDVIAAALKVR